MTATGPSSLTGLGRLARWRLAARPKTLPLSQTPVLAASWLAASGLGDWSPDVTLAALLSAGAIQIGTNLWNDAADAARGVDGKDRLGPPRVTALGLIDAAEVRRAATLAFALAALAGLYLVWLGGLVIVAIGTVSLALGYLYSIGPRPLSGLPVGEALVFVFFGLVAVSATGWLQGVYPIAPRTLLTGAMIGLPAVAVLMLNNHRDRAQDARAGRRTLAIVIGPAASRWLYVATLAAALALAAGLGAGLLLLPAALLGAWLSWAMLRWPVSARLNRLLGLTALFQLALLVAVALG